MAVFDIVTDFGAIPVGQPGGDTAGNGAVIRNAIATVAATAGNHTLHFPPGEWRLDAASVLNAPVGRVTLTGVMGDSWLSVIGANDLIDWTGCVDTGFDGLSFDGRNHDARVRVTGGSGVFFRRQRNAAARGFELFNGLAHWRIEDAHWYEPHAAGAQIGATGAYATDAAVVDGIMDGFTVVGSWAEAIDIQCHSARNTLRNLRLLRSNLVGQEEYIDAGGGTQVDLLIEDAEIDHDGPQVSAIASLVAMELAAPNSVTAGMFDPAGLDPRAMARAARSAGSLYPFTGTPIVRGVNVKTENATRPLRPILRRVTTRLSSTDPESAGIACDATDGVIDACVTRGATVFGFSLGPTGNGTIRDSSGDGGTVYGAAVRGSANWTGINVALAVGPLAYGISGTDILSRFDFAGQVVGGLRGVNFQAPDQVAQVTCIGSGTAYYMGVDAARAVAQHARAIGCGLVADIRGADQVVQAVSASGPGPVGIHVRAGASNARIEAVPMTGFAVPVQDAGTGTQRARQADRYLLMTWSADPTPAATQKAQIEAHVSARRVGFWMLPAHGAAVEVDPQDGTKRRFRAAIQAGAEMP